jgi:3',5'-nucleoside bisphosphate phosphatase
MKVDLHNHSNYSDGFFSPGEVVKFAYDAGCNLFSLTDHDSTDGICEAQLEASKLGLKLIHGVEISAFWRNMTIHIIGLGIDIDNDILQTGLKHNRDLRLVRAEKIALGLRRSGIKEPLEKAQNLSGGHMLTRTHFAQMLINEGYCKDMKAVFRRYLYGKMPGGVRVEWKGFDEVVHWIHSAGGKAFIAHPFRYRMTHTKIKNMVKDFKEVSGDGFEVVNANSSKEEISLGNQWSEELDLLTSCGSDFHGWPNQRVQIGNLSELPNHKRAVWSHI